MASSNATGEWWAAVQSHRRRRSRASGRTAPTSNACRRHSSVAPWPLNTPPQIKCRSLASSMEDFSKLGRGGGAERSSRLVDKWASRDAIGVRRGDAGPRQVHSGVQVHQGECRSRWGGIARLPDGLRAELTRKPRLFVSRLAPLGGPDPPGRETVDRGVREEGGRVQRAEVHVRGVQAGPGEHEV